MPSTSAGAAVGLTSGARSRRDATLTGEGQRREHRRPWGRRAPESRPSAAPRSVWRRRSAVSTVASGPAAFARASVLPRARAPSPLAATSPIDTRSCQGPTRRTARPRQPLRRRPRAPTGVRPRRAWPGNRPPRRAGRAAGGVSLRRLRAARTPTTRPRPAFGAAIARIHQRHVLGADPGVAIAANRKRRWQLLGDESVDRGGAQQRLGALARILDLGRRRRRRRPTSPAASTPATIARFVIRLVNLNPA